MKKILLLCVTSQNVITFRLGLIKALQDKGYDVSVVAFDSDYTNEIDKIGVNFFCLNDSNRGLNPFKLATLTRKYTKIIKKVNPDIVFSFMLKPNIFGVFAAKSQGAKKIYSMVEGVGDVFINNTLKWKVIRVGVCLLYKSAFRFSRKVFFLNNDDRNEFVERGLVNPNQCVVIPGIGVDLDYFAQKPLKNYTTFLMVSRMLKTKGIVDYCECAREVRKIYPEAKFNYLGAEGNVTLKDISQYIEDESINYLGTTKDVRPYLEDCSCLILPSSREGCPMSIMEAEATGRCVITYDSIGCKTVIEDNKNGFVVPCNNPIAIAKKCLYLLNTPDELVSMGKNSRIFAENNFDSRVINNKIISIITEE